MVFKSWVSKKQKSTCGKAEKKKKNNTKTHIPRSYTHTCHDANNPNVTTKYI